MTTHISHEIETIILNYMFVYQLMTMFVYKIMSMFLYYFSVLRFINSAQEKKYSDKKYNNYL